MRAGDGWRVVACATPHEPRQQELYGRCLAAAGEVKDAIDDASPDVVLVVSNPHRVSPEDNQATPARRYALGQALRRAIERWDSGKRVAIMASGGLSHQIVDEDLDRTVVNALLAKDVAYWK